MHAAERRRPARGSPVPDFRVADYMNGGILRCHGIPAPLSIDELGVLVRGHGVPAIRGTPHDVRLTDGGRQSLRGTVHRSGPVAPLRRAPGLLIGRTGSAGPCSDEARWSLPMTTTLQSTSALEEDDQCLFNENRTS